MTFGIEAQDMMAFISHVMIIIVWLIVLCNQFLNLTSWHNGLITKQNQPNNTIITSISKKESRHKLYFKYGAMNASKTALAVMTAHSYKQQKKKVQVIKPKIDNRESVSKIKSRCGVSYPVDILFNDLTNIEEKIDLDGVSVVIVDEAQFLTTEQVEQLRRMTNSCPVLCYGLLTDYTTHVFPGALRLVELADKLCEIKSVCTRPTCNSKATINAKYMLNRNMQRVYIRNGDTAPDIGGNDKYESMCWHCWNAAFTQHI